MGAQDMPAPPDELPGFARRRCADPLIGVGAKVAEIRVFPAIIGLR
jgi:hypothetical protein